MYKTFAALDNVSYLFFYVLLPEGSLSYDLNLDIFTKNSNVLGGKGIGSLLRLLCRAGPQTNR